jgi:hypothetical protein
VGCGGGKKKKNRLTFSLHGFLVTASLSLTSRLGGARRPQRRNVAVGAPPGDRRVRVLHRAPRRLRLPERHLRTHTRRPAGHLGQAQRRARARARQAEVRRPGAAAYESVALGAAGEAVRDDDGLQDVAVPLEVLPEPLRGRLPRQPAHEHLRQRRVAEPRPRPAGGRRPRRGRRRRRGCCHHERARTHTGGKPRWRGAAAAGLASREGGARGELLLCLRRGTPPCRALALSFGNGPASPLLYKTTL